MAVKKERPTIQEEIKVDSSQSEIDILREQNKILQEQMRQQMEMMTALMANQSKPAEKDESTRRVKIIHLMQPSHGLTTHIALSKLTLDFTRYGEERYLRYDDFLELTGVKFKVYFKINVIAISSGDEDLIERYDLAPLESNILDSFHLQNISKIPFEELEILFKNLCWNHKLLITRLWSKGYYDGEDMSYRDRRKVEMFNEVTEGAMENILSELDAERRKK